MNKKILILIVGSFVLLSFYYRGAVGATAQKPAEKMKIEIWSDVVCPWCYIGKRKLENAIAKFEHADQVEIIYKSYQLNPAVKTDTTMNPLEHLAKKLNVSMEQVQAMNQQVATYAAQSGLKYSLNEQVTTNTLRAHLLLQYAKQEGLQFEMKGKLMQAYFSEGLNIDNTEVLMKIAKQVGLKNSTAALFDSAELKKQVQGDIQKASDLGIGGVPYFLFNGQEGISGAQEEAVFLQALKVAFQKWNQKK